MTNLSAHSYKVFEWPSKTVGLELQNEIEQFYYREAQLLDHRAYEAWFALLDKDIRYFMPLRTNRMIREGELEYSGDQDFAHFDETYETMYGRIRKVTSDLGWAENPPSRTRHLISNVIVKETATPDTFEVNSAFISSPANAGTCCAAPTTTLASASPGAPSCSTPAPCCRTT
ncbi:biphenyl 2,3-dioxygenase small subunit (BphA2) [Pseudoxanthomonas spadix BD-a59]|uniref:Biphenyl 2,3-dioxygenase small subunit (BphA2) n=1 Tax=Pseudoxanthomonas spadix (strain BD-a59) TaxID=1045855 RepID=G7UVT1_PSEUP|nr:biphenyl 2,3-dioxygenase small subunit (BphA2) [Pseudoxanthomonas spadix BD-a59]